MGMAPPLPPGSRPGGEVCMQHVVAVTMMQANLAAMPGQMAANGGVPGASFGAIGSGVPGSSTAEALLTGTASAAKQSPFPMPLSPPHDLTYCSPMGHPQTYFETWAGGNQQGCGSVQMGNCPSMCMGVQMNGGSGPGGPGLFLS